MDSDAHSFGPEDQVAVSAFTRQSSRDGVIIGLPDARAFIALPAEAVELLDQLAAGSTVGEAAAYYLAKYEETPALDELLVELAARGFVRSITPGESPAAAAARATQAASPLAGQRAARAIFSKLLLGAGAALVALALALLATTPELIPGPRSIYFTDHRTRYLLVLVLWNYVAVVIHEMAHATAARAAGVKARFGIGTRLWVLVAETDLTGLWALPKRQRFLPLLAGAAVDALSFSVCVVVLALQRRAVIALPVPAVKLIAAVSFTYLMRLLWQCFVFVRTDFYYVIANFCDCANLMQDTEALLRHYWRRAVRWGRERARPEIPAAELRCVRLFAPVWLGGRILAFLSLFLITLPVTLLYIRSVAHALTRGTSPERADGLGVVVLSVLMFGPVVWGLALWLVSFAKREVVR